MKDFVVDDDVLDAAALAELQRAIRSSRLIGESQLVGPFDATRGFGVACHVAAVEEALDKVPWLRSFLALALDDDRRARLLEPSLVDRVGAAVFGDVNALYVNVLVVNGGGAVARHVDSTLGVVEGDDVVYVPRAVAVLYVDVPPDLQGGQLRLWNGDVDAGAVTPKENRFVMFRGALGHEVTPVTSTTPRISCVCELYALPRPRLLRLPRVRLQSQGFKAVLDRLRGNNDA